MQSFFFIFLKLNFDFLMHFYFRAALFFRIQAIREIRKY